MNKEFSLEILIKNYLKLSHHNKQNANKYIKELRVKQDKGKNDKKIDNFGYLDKFTMEVKEFVINIIDTEGLNLYHSAAAYIMNRKEKQPDEIYKEYLLQYKSEREYLMGNEDIIEELVSVIYEKFKRRGSI